MMMEEDKKDLMSEEDPPPYSDPLPPRVENSPSRNKKPTRFYHGFITLVMCLFLLLCAIALGSFGEFQRQLSGFYVGDEYKGRGLCILFAKSQALSEPGKDGAKWLIDYRSYGPCIFIFWGLVSGTLLAFILLVYEIVMVIIAPRM